MSYQKVPQRLKDFCDWLNERRRAVETKDIDAVYELSFMAHYNLVYIHPWADGNGRMSRLVMNMIQMEYDLIPSIVKKESRNKYIESLAKAQDEERPEIFIGFMTDLHISNIEYAIAEYRASIENDTLNLKNDTLNDTIKLSEKENAVLTIIKEKTDISINEIVEETGFSRPTVTRSINSLKEKQLLERVGARKNGHWVVRW